MQMGFDSGASTTTFPPEVGEGYDLIKDQFAGRKYHGARPEVIGDEGRRTINVLDENWNSKSMKHRVADLRNPPVAASQTVHAGNLVLMDEDHSFVVPLGLRLARGPELDLAVRDWCPHDAL